MPDIAHMVRRCGALVLPSVLLALSGCGNAEGTGSTRVVHASADVDRASALGVPKECASLFGTAVALYCKAADRPKPSSQPSSAQANVTIERSGPITAVGAEPGVASGLGSALSRGATIALSGKDRGGLLFVLARSDYTIITARFADVRLNGERVRLRLECHSGDPTVVLLAKGDARRYPDKELLVEAPEEMRAPDLRAPTAC